MRQASGLALDWVVESGRSFWRRSPCGRGVSFGFRKELFRQLSLVGGGRGGREVWSPDGLRLRGV